MSGTRNLYFTPEMDEALLKLRGTRPMTEVFRAIGVARLQGYRRLRELGQPIRAYRKHNRTKGL